MTVTTEHRIKFTVRFDHPVKVWVLQLGGWLPIQFSPASIILLDKNIKIALDGLAKDPDRDDMKAERWWLSQLNSERFQLNPMMCAYEGSSQAAPSFKEFREALESSTAAIAASLPRARMVRQLPEHLPTLFENVTAVVEREAREIQFMCDVAPLIAERVASQGLRRVESTILDTARTNQLSLQSLPVLCALSCLYEPSNGTQPMIGRGVMKPTLAYGPREAYNAVSDLRAIEFLSMAIGLERETPGYCTRDKALAAFWTYLRVAAPTWNKDHFSATLAPAQELFPRLNQHEVVELVSRLK